MVWTTERRDDALIPGMEVTEIRFDGLERKDIIIEWLDKQVSKLVNEEIM